MRAAFKAVEFGKQVAILDADDGGAGGAAFSVVSGEDGGVSVSD